MGGISLDRLHQVRDQVVAQLELHVDVVEGRLPTQRPVSLGRRHDGLGSGFRQKKTPGFSPGVTSSNGGSGGKGGCRPTITQLRGPNAAEACWFLGFQK